MLPVLSISKTILTCGSCTSMLSLEQPASVAVIDEDPLGSEFRLSKSRPVREPQSTVEATNPINHQLRRFMKYSNYKVSVEMQLEQYWDAVQFSPSK